MGDVIKQSGLNKPDIFRFNGKTFTRSYALASGLIDEEGRPTAKAEKLYGSERLTETLPARNRDRKALRESADVETTEDGKIIAKPKPKPLKPRNVRKDGTPIEDEAELARIAAETKAIEAAAKAKRDADDTEV